MNVLTLQGDPAIDVTVRRSARARRMTLRVSRLDGRVTLTVPRGVREREAQEFLQERRDWICGHIAQHVPSQRVGFGSEVPVLGQMRRIVSAPGRRIHMDELEVHVPGAPDMVGRKLQAWLKAMARTELAFASDHYAKALGLPYSKLTMRDTRSRWGSCTSAGGLMYSWRLIMAPADVLTYVAAHEVAHLKEMNHSPDFWHTLEALYGDYRPPKTWLRREGHQLHTYRFVD